MLDSDLDLLLPQGRRTSLNDVAQLPARTALSGLCLSVCFAQTSQSCTKQKTPERPLPNGRNEANSTTFFLQKLLPTVPAVHCCKLIGHVTRRMAKATLSAIANDGVLNGSP